MFTVKNDCGWFSKNSEWDTLHDAMNEFLRVKDAPDPDTEAINLTSDETGELFASWNIEVDPVKGVTITEWYAPAVFI